MKIDLKKEATFYKEQVIGNLQLMCSIANDVPPFEEIQFDIQTCDQINFSQFEMNDVIYLSFSKKYPNPIKPGPACAPMTGVNSLMGISNVG